MLIYTQLQDFLLQSSIKIGPRDAFLVSNFSVTLLAMHVVFFETSCTHVSLNTVLFLFLSVRCVSYILSFKF